MRLNPLKCAYSLLVPLHQALQMPAWFDKGLVLWIDLTKEDNLSAFDVPEFFEMKHLVIIT